MFSSPYNSLAFNGGLSFGVDFAISGVSSIAFGGNLLFGARYVVNGSTELRFDMLAAPARAFPVVAKSSVDFVGMGDPARLIRCESNAVITAVASVRLLADYSVGGVGDIKHSMRAHPCADYIVFGDGRATFNAAAIPVRVIRARDMFSALVFGGRAITGDYTTESMYIDIALGVGQTLVIDTENYLVTLDGENVIDKHSGGWFYLVSGSRGLVVEPALETTVMFTEKWL